MSIRELYVKRHDLKYWYFQIKDSAGNVDLTSGTVVCTAKNKRTGELVVNRQACNKDVGTDGTGEYRPSAGDVDTTMELSVEFEVTPASGPKFTVPEKLEDEFRVIIVPDLDDV